MRITLNELMCKATLQALYPNIDHKIVVCTHRHSHVADIAFLCKNNFGAYFWATMGSVQKIMTPNNVKWDADPYVFLLTAIMDNYHYVHIFNNEFELFQWYFEHHCRWSEVIGDGYTYKLIKEIAPLRYSTEKQKNKNTEK